MRESDVVGAADIILAAEDLARLFGANDRWPNRTTVVEGLRSILEELQRPGGRERVRAVVDEVGIDPLFLACCELALILRTMPPGEPRAAWAPAWPV